MNARTRTSERAPRLQRRPTPAWLLALMAVLLALPLAVVIAGPAAAHTKVVSSSPANGSSLTSTPTEVSLTFDEVPQSITSVRAQSSDGPLVAVGEPVLNDKTVTVSWPQGQAPGLYRLVCVLVSDDGDPVEETVIFSYSSTGVTVAAPVPAVDAESTMGKIWILGVVIVALAALALLLQTRRRRPLVDLADEPLIERETMTTESQA